MSIREEYVQKKTKKSPYSVQNSTGREMKMSLEGRGTLF
jgi:hypothetical protein